MDRGEKRLFSYLQNQDNLKRIMVNKIRVGAMILLCTNIFIFSCRTGAPPTVVELDTGEILDTGETENIDPEDTLDSEVDTSPPSFCEQDLSGQGNEGTCFTKRLSCGDTVEMNLEEGTLFYDYAFYAEDSISIANGLGGNLDLPERAFIVEPISGLGFTVSITEYCDDIKLIVYPWEFANSTCPTDESVYGDREWLLSEEDEPKMVFNDTQTHDGTTWIFIVEGKGGNFALHFE